MPLLPSDRSYMDASIFEAIHSSSTSRNCDIAGPSTPSPIWPVISLGHWKRSSTPSGLYLGQKEEIVPEWTIGRPIISFVDSPFRPMLNILARLIFQLIPVACPDHFASGDVYTLLTILQTAPVDGDLILINQDLAGFFTSIDQARFIGAWHMLLDFLSPHVNVGENEVFSVYPGKSNNPGDLIKGRTFRRLNVTRKIGIKDVPSLIKTALDMQTFALGNRCIRQRRGSPMGSPLSPALCLMVVSISEQVWSINFKQVLTNHNLFIKHICYVDNRLIFGDARLRDLPPHMTSFLMKVSMGNPSFLRLNLTKNSSASCWKQNLSS